MNSADIEIYEAIREVHSDPTVIRYLCFLCKAYLTDWEVEKGRGGLLAVHKNILSYPKGSGREPRAQGPERRPCFSSRMANTSSCLINDGGFGGYPPNRPPHLNPLPLKGARTLALDSSSIERFHIPIYHYL